MKQVKYLINILGSGILAWSIWMRYILWVMPPIGNTKEESIKLLKNKIIEIGIEKSLCAIGIILILIFVTWVIQKMIEKKVNRKELLVIFGINLLIFGAGLLIGATEAFNGLSIEIERIF